jgi:hypothetical protein
MKIEIKNAILEMLSDDATITELRDTAEDFTWVFDYVKSNAEQLRTRFKTESYNSTGYAEDWSLRNKSTETKKASHSTCFFCFW